MLSSEAVGRKRGRPPFRRIRELRATIYALPCPPSLEAPSMTPADQRRLLDDVEAFCQEVRPVEELCYVEHRFNDQVLPLAKKYNVLGIPVPKEYGGRG